MRLQLHDVEHSLLYRPTLVASLEDLNATQAREGLVLATSHICTEYYGPARPKPPCNQMLSTAWQKLKDAGQSQGLARAFPELAAYLDLAMDIRGNVLARWHEDLLWDISKDSGYKGGDTCALTRASVDHFVPRCRQEFELCCCL